MTKVNLEDLVSLCKRRGFIYQGSELYGGLSGTWDWGPLGLSLKRNLTNLWWQKFVEEPDNMYGIESSILMNAKIWQASGHESTFHDPVIEDVKTKQHYRLDHLLADNKVDPKGMSLEDMANKIKELKIKSPDGNELGNPSRAGQMFKTNVGSVEDESSLTYLRPETAQGMFVNFRNIVDSYYPDIPFGIAQVGRNFRNEISPRDFIFRSREFEIMELEYFIDPSNWEADFDNLRLKMREWFEKTLGLSKENIKEVEIDKSDRAHYSDRTIDFNYKFPGREDELAGLAYRSDFDLSNHQKHSGKNLEYAEKGSNRKFLPHVIEPTFGLERHVLAVLTEYYKEDEINGEKRTYLALPANLAPVKVAVFPLLKNKPELVKYAHDVYGTLKQKVGLAMWDDNGNIGKRYRRQDEIGTPYCVTVDFQSLEDKTVTLRNRDTTEQKRMTVNEVLAELGKS
ncbi:MAG TPA: glycine--tRNA ligase [Candidatus Saccharimonadales bacterium]|nr:glycine--tRNA ligase [Candidatus Saccharimonadales bacterium]